jgi:hypothetical protein
VYQPRTTQLPIWVLDTNNTHPGHFPAHIQHPTLGTRRMSSPEARASKRRTIQPTGSKSSQSVSTQCYGVFQRPYSLENRGISVQAVHCFHAVSQILHTNCTRVAPEILKERRLETLTQAHIWTQIMASS